MPARDPLTGALPYVLRDQLVQRNPPRIVVGTAINMITSEGRVTTDFGGGTGTYINVTVPYGIQDRAPAAGDIVICLAYQDSLIVIATCKPAV